LSVWCFLSRLLIRGRFLFLLRRRLWRDQRQKKNDPDPSNCESKIAACGFHGVSLGFDRPAERFLGRENPFQLLRLSDTGLRRSK
jgi:hypothetical protein